MKADSFKDHVLDQLAGLGALHRRCMFGGHGIHLDDTFFAIIYQGRLHFKTTEQTRKAYLDAGSEPFQPSATRTLACSHEVPASVLEDTVILKDWAMQAASTES